MRHWALYHRHVKPRLTVEAVYGDLPLRWRGGKGRCACPLHGGDNPRSFNVWAEGLNWYCRTHCEPSSGGPVEYIQRALGLSTREAIAHLARRVRGLPARALPRRPAPARLEQVRLPAAEVAAVWAAAGPVTGDREAVEWLKRFALDPARVARLDLARVLPHGAKVPEWAAHWFWKRTFGPPPAWRLLLPVYDLRGRLASLRARSLLHPPPSNSDGNPLKEMAPRGGGTTGLILADSWGRRLLAGDPAAKRRARRRGLLIAEGTKDLLTVATEPGAPPTWAIYSDSWTPKHAARVPDGTTVTIATHADTKGHEYANNIGRAFHGRPVELRRLDWSKEG